MRNPCPLFSPPVDGVRTAGAPREDREALAGRRREPAADYLETRLPRGEATLGGFGSIGDLLIDRSMPANKPAGTLEAIDRLEVDDGIRTSLAAEIAHLVPEEERAPGEV